MRTRTRIICFVLVLLFLTTFTQSAFASSGSEDGLRMYNPSTSYGKQQLDVATPGAPLELNAAAVSGGNFISPNMPQLTFAWYAANSEWEPVGSLLSEEPGFAPPTDEIGMERYICFGYWRGSRIQSDVRCICIIEDIEDLSFRVEPDPARVGQPASAEAWLGKELIGAHPSNGWSAVIRSWAEDLIGQSFELLDGALSMRMWRDCWTQEVPGEEGSGSFVEEYWENPAELASISERDAQGALRYRGYTYYQTADYEGTVTLASNAPIPMRLFDESGEPIDPEIVIEDAVLADVFPDSAHCTQDMLREALSLEDGETLVISRDDETLDASDWTATGDAFEVQDAAGWPVRAGVLVLMGDVMGTGSMNLSQLIRLTAALRENAPLEGPYLAAGDFSQTGSINLSDVVRESQLFRASYEQNAGHRARTI